ncbi:ROK family transcriptional regulator [Sinisalibacter aestuarii]|uniref:Xylose operon repressor n=1 Tax=Sinisalibacter aestuarii TaxID=2949426 RepID=A0ABQ5LMY0_9RHOB|nr:ROK family transcriptional regulator [Sinisalibacter aestuarii]GKY86369.1 xylose operon repressor [Sinisalibacter aestuarii]
MAKLDRAAGTGDSRDKTRQQVVSLIRSAGQIARIDIAAATGVSPATITAITQEMIQAGLVEEVAPEAGRVSGRGRPRVSLRLRGNAHIVAGIKVSFRTLSLVLIDFEGNPLGEQVWPLSAPRVSPEALAQDIRALLVAATAEIGRKIEDISGLGVGLAGTIDAIEGFVHWSPSLTARNVQLRDMLEAALPMTVFLDNDANLVAKAEQLFGEARGVRDFIVVTIEQGVGMGIVIDGEVFRGTRGCGAEFGHTKVHLDGAICRCGQRGCLEAYVADYALLREADVSLPAAAAGATTEERLALLFDAAHEGDPTARSIIRRASRMFAMGLANLVNIFDPKLVILSGERMSHDFLYSDAVLAEMHDSVVQVDAPPPEVKIHKWGDQMWAKGAAAYAMEGVTELAVRRLTVDA